MVNSINDKVNSIKMLNNSNLMIKKHRETKISMIMNTEIIIIIHRTIKILKTKDLLKIMIMIFQILKIFQM